jgi:hypothetical protein
VRIVLAAASAAAGGSAAPAWAIESWQIQVGYQKLLNALNGAVPTGAGVAVSQVEAPQGTPEEIENGQGRYMADAAAPDFSAAGDPLGQAVQLNDGSGFAANGVSSHATSVGMWIYGNNFGLAKATNSITMYDAERWLNDVLKYGGTQAPAAQPFKVQNHSWIGNLSQANSDEAALRRYDYIIETDEVSAIVGANNNPIPTSSAPPDPNFPHPNLFAHSYNAIVVGRTDSKHSRGVTGTVYGLGRYRPDIVSLAPSTSAATGQVSSAATLIRGVTRGTDADRSETTKAILLAGATKQEFATFIEPSTNTPNPWDRMPSRPVDDIFGAGELNIYNSYLMTVGGQNPGSTSAPTTAVSSHGWDYQDRKSDSAVGDIYYNFVIPAGSTAQELSIMLAWNVEVTDNAASSSVFVPVQSLQNLDLAFYNSSTSFLGELLDESVSTIDNVEHIYRTNLEAGTYTLKVSGAAGWDYGLAWRTDTLFNLVNADFDEDGLVTGNDFLVWQINVGTLVGALHTDGDADGDGDVDSDDLTLFRTALAAPQSSPPPIAGGGAPGFIAAVPEPAALVTGAIGAGLLALALRDNRRRRG